MILRAWVLMTEGPDILLTSDDPPPVSVHNEDGESPFLIVVDHAGNDMPRALGRLGALKPKLLESMLYETSAARARS